MTQNAMVRVADHPSQRSRIHRLARTGDSWEYHASRDAFELDRRRQNGLMLSGYRVLRFTAAMITGEPRRVIGAIKDIRRLLRGG